MIKTSFIKDIEKKSASLSRRNNKADLGTGSLPRQSPTQSDTFAKLRQDTFATNIVTFPEDLGSSNQGHFIMFYINEQNHANVQFGNSNKVQPIYQMVTSGQGQPGGRSTYEMVAVPNGSGFVTPSQQDSINDQKGKSTVSVKRAPTTRMTTAIGMYMPAQVNSNQTTQYSDADVGGLAKILNAFGTGLMRSGSFEAAFDNMRPDLKTSAKEMAKSSLDAVAPGAKAIAEIQAGKVFSNRLETVFKGIDKRTFSFQFTMMPKSENEANIAKKIVEMFRFYSAPSFEGAADSSRVFVVPATFDIEYRINGGKENSYLNRISTCVMKSIDVSYGGERVQFFRPNSEGAPPVQTQMTLNFQELEVITRERIAAGY